MWHVRFESLCASPMPFAQTGFSGAVESFPFCARRSNFLTSPTTWLRASAVEPYFLHICARTSPNIVFEALRSSRASAARPSRCLAFTVGFSKAPPCFVHFAVVPKCSTRRSRERTPRPEDPKHLHSPEASPLPPAG